MRLLVYSDRKPGHRWIVEGKVIENSLMIDETTMAPFGAIWVRTTTGIRSIVPHRYFFEGMVFWAPNERGDVFE